MSLRGGVMNEQVLPGQLSASLMLFIELAPPVS